MSSTSSMMETVIIGSLLHNGEFSTAVLPHAKPDYFENESHQHVFKLINEYNGKYGAMPTREAVTVEIETLSGLSEETFAGCQSLADKVFEPNVVEGLKCQDKQWLLEKTEKHFKDRACYLAIMKSVDILDGTEKKISRDAIPDLLADAIKISFETDLGHDYFDNWEGRFAYYNRVENKLPWPLYMLNRVTGGGPTRKSLCLAVAGTGIGKTIWLCNTASHYLMQGYKVLYVTLEMAEEMIAQRIDARMMQAKMDDVPRMAKEVFENGINKIRRNAKNGGKLVIKQWPPRTITVKHIEAYLAELKAKQNFVPDVIVLDYLTLLNSYMLGKVGADNLYITGKYVAEEVRALAIRKDILIMSASQTNRNGQTDQDFDLTDLGESHAISQTVDFAFGMITNPDMESMGHVRFKLLKSRFGSITTPSSFIVGLDRDKMTFYDIDVAQEESASQQQQQQQPAIPSTSEVKKAKFNFD